MLDIGFHDEGYGYDLFGMQPRAVRRMLRWIEPVYTRYFRVRAHGVANIPATGPAILVANHSGSLPIDGLMLWADVVRRTGRVPRLVGDHFIPQLPIISTLFARGGVVTGTRTNVRRLLERGELIAIFPEGTTGIAKPFRDRYHLQEWRVGHAELALRYRAPIVPVAIVGAEESWPMALKIRGFHAFGAPYLPVPATPVPMPVHYHIWYGEPIDLAARFGPEHADDPDIAAEAASVVQTAVQLLVERGLEERRGVYR